MGQQVLENSWPYSENALLENINRNSTMHSHFKSQLQFKGSQCTLPVNIINFGISWMLLVSLDVTLSRSFTLFCLMSTRDLLTIYDQIRDSHDYSGAPLFSLKLYLHFSVYSVKLTHVHCAHRSGTNLTTCVAENLSFLGF